MTRLATAVAKLGIRSVTGALVLDDGPFDRVFVHPSWSASDLDDWYGAPVAGLGRGLLAGARHGHFLARPCLAPDGQWNVAL